MKPLSAFFAVIMFALAACGHIAPANAAEESTNDIAKSARRAAIAKTAERLCGVKDDAFLKINKDRFIKLSGFHEGEANITFDALSKAQEAFVTRMRQVDGFCASIGAFMKEREA